MLTCILLLQPGSRLLRACVGVSMRDFCCAIPFGLFDQDTMSEALLPAKENCTVGRSGAGLLSNASTWHMHTCGLGVQQPSPTSAEPLSYSTCTARLRPRGIINALLVF